MACNGRRKEESQGWVNRGYKRRRVGGREEGWGQGGGLEHSNETWRGQRTFSPFSLQSKMECF